MSEVRAMPTAEQVEIRALAHEFAAGELRPHAARWDEHRRVDDGVFAKLAELGFLAMLAPERHGGLDFDMVTYAAVLEELAWGDASVALAVAVHNGSVAGLIGHYGTEAQQGEWLPRLASGEVLGACALAEPGFGGDAAAMTVRAEPLSGGWRLEGEKRWVVNGGRAGLFVVFARTSATGLGAFLLAPGRQAIAVSPEEPTMGLRTSETVRLELDGVRVGAEALLGDGDDGSALVLEVLDVGRVGTAALAVGVGRAALEHAATYALGREQFTRPIARFEAIQAKLADVARGVEAGRALVHEAARALDAARAGGGAPPRGLSSVTARAALAKLAASEAATAAADEAIQIFGGYGYMRHYPVERLLRDAKGTELLDGTSEVLRTVIAREILHDAGDPED